MCIFILRIFYKKSKKEAANNRNITECLIPLDDDVKECVDFLLESVEKNLTELSNSNKKITDNFSEHGVHNSYLEKLTDIENFRFNNYPCIEQEEQISLVFNNSKKSISKKPIIDCNFSSKK